MNALQLISAGMRITNALASGETPTSAEAQDSLVILNQMMDGWTAERLMVWTIVIQQFTLVPGQQTYTLGTGGDFDYPRPARLERASVIWSGNVGQPLEYPLELLTTPQWQDVPVKNIQSTIPQYLYDDGAFPYRNLSYWCIPTVADPTLLYMWQALAQFADLTTDYTFPPGYAEAIQYNLALRLAANNIGTVTNQLTVALAQNGISVVKRMNIPLIDLRVDPALPGQRGKHYDWRSDTFV